MKLELRNVCVHCLHVLFFFYLRRSICHIFILPSFVLSSKQNKTFNTFHVFFFILRMGSFRYLVQGLYRVRSIRIMCFHCLNILRIACSTQQTGARAKMMMVMEKFITIAGFRSSPSYSGFSVVDCVSHRVP